MFVRWKTRKNTLYAYLCQSERKDGKPVSSTLGYLGSCSANATAEQQQAFWAQAETNLQPHNLSETDKTKIENAIAQKIPRNISNQQKSSNISPFLQGILESYLDGVLILTDQGEWIEANDYARHVCTQLIQHQHPNQLNGIPQPIWRVCEALIDSQSIDAEQPVIIESEIKSAQFPTLRIRARWLKFNALEPPYLLVLLEDRRQSIQYLALKEADRYGLTPREAEIWLLRRSNHTFKEIASELYISLNTVKKHLKNIFAKQKMVGL